MKQSFNSLIKNLKNSIATYDYFINFTKVFDRVSDVELKLNIMNYLIGKENFDYEFNELLYKYPSEIVTVIPVLLALRHHYYSIIDKKQMKVYDFSSYNPEIDYLEFIKKSGIILLFENKRIKNLVDYVTGVEVGLDTNGRKNRSGKVMSSIVKGYLDKISNIQYLEEASINKIKTNFNIDLSVSTINNKRFDFAIKNRFGKLFLIEVNYYSGGGSKLNEVSRSYINLSADINKIDNVEFVWITDGNGWKSAKKNLEEAYNKIEYLFTIFDLEESKLEHLFN